MKHQLVLTALLIFSSAPAWSQKIQFNPDAPLYIEYKSSIPTQDADVSVQIDDTTGSAKIRLTLQSKPDAGSTYYGYIWLQIGKKVTKEVIFKRGKPLSGWLTNQDDIQALFLFDNEKEMTDFKAKAAQAKKPLLEKATLPQLQAPAVPPPASTTSKAIEIGAEMGEIEKYAKLMEAYNAFSPEQKKVNDEKAALLARSAVNAYQAKNYPAAETQFEESLRLNPTIGINKYYLGVSYYQTKKYDKSLALLSLAEGADYNYAEYNYYTGMNNLKLKNYTKASENFDMTKEENDPDYSGSAAFFNGHILFQKEDYPQARQNFEYTIDHSKSPKMDAEAEAMLEKIDAAEGLSGKSRDKFRYTLFVAFGYDSNVLDITEQNRATGNAGYRLLYGGEFNYKFLNNATQDMTLGINASDYYSVNDKFKSDAEIQAVDPLTYGASLAYNRRFQIGRRQFTWGITPGYQVINMAYETSNRDRFLDITMFTSDLTFAISEKHFSKFTIGYAKEKMVTTPALPEDSLTADNFGISTTQTFVTSAKVKESWIGNFSYTVKAADGDNSDNNKAYVGATYQRMGIWDAINSIRLSYTNSKYPNATIGRNDDIMSANLGLAKELNKNLNLYVNGLYTLSESTNESYKYNKFAIQTMLSYNGAF